jgi:hypothetical protein
MPHVTWETAAAAAAATITTTTTGYIAMGTRIPQHPAVFALGLISVLSPLSTRTKTWIWHL